MNKIDSTSENIDKLIDNVDDIDLSCVGKSRFTNVSIDAKRIRRAIIEAGENAFGIMAIDLWTLNEQDGKLYHYGHSGLNWISPLYRSQVRSDIDKLDVLDRLVNVERPDYLKPLPQSCGFGLAGICWSQHTNLLGSMGALQPLLWRQISEFTSDPDLLPYERMFELEKVFGKVAGIPFDVMGFKGVVLYFARDTAKNESLNAIVNVEFLNFATFNIASAAAMTLPRLQSVDNRKEIASNAIRRVQHELSKLAKHKKPQIIMKQSEIGALKIKLPFSTSTHLSKVIANKVQSTINKSINTPGIHPPNGVPLNIAFTSFMGSFLTLVILGSLNEFIEKVTDSEYALTLGPFGALLTLQYALTAAPAAQPRNSIYGIFLSVSLTIIAKGILYNLLDTPLWMVAALATSASIMIMQITGLVHPPAGAAAMVFSLRENDFKSDWVYLALLMLADFIALIVATLINNASDSRQYPMYWDLNMCGGSFYCLTDEEKDNYFETRSNTSSYSRFNTSWHRSIQISHQESKSSKFLSKLSMHRSFGFSTHNKKSMFKEEV